MIINSSVVGMAANTVQRTTYTERQESYGMNLQRGTLNGGSNSFVKSYTNARTDRLLQNNTLRDTQAAENFMMQLRMYLFEMRNQMLMTIGQKRGNILSFAKNAGQTSIWNRLEYQSCTYEEQETMTFETEGKAVTADGRTITFNVQLEMSRAYSESVEYLTQSTSIMTDPLVISLDANPVSVSDQKWQFDIDGDGKTDSISKLSKGSGYLVFDRNGDGVINDGTEMFGARTGNGFAELADYDEDGNGWIDENDSIYEKLAVWMKDDAGNDRMVGLKAANVGAIYLGSVASDFAFKSMEDNQHNAQLRRSGMYLTEDGRANTIAQLDMVKALITG